MTTAAAYFWRHREAHASLSPAWARAWVKRAYRVPSLVELTVRVGRLRRAGAEIGDNVALGRATLDGDARNLAIGEGSAIDEATIALWEKVRIGRCVAINKGAAIFTGTHDTASPLWESTYEPVRIDDYAWIGSNAILMPGAHIGRGAVVAAGAVVAGRVAPGAIVLGNPARRVWRRGTDDFRYVPSLAWPLMQAWLGFPEGGPAIPRVEGQP